MQDSALYQSLHRLEARGLALAEWGVTENNQRARYYTLTPQGREQLGHEEAGFAKMMLAIRRVMRSV